MTPSVRSECGLQRARCSFRIKEVLDRRGLTLTAIARDMGLSVEAISKVVRGYSHSGRILDRLRQERVPEKYLYDPRRVSGQQETSKEKAVA